MASTAVLRALRRREFAAPLRHLSDKLISPPSQKWASLVRPFSSKPVVRDANGVDLGTANSRVSVMEGKTTKVIENIGARTTPIETTTKRERQLLKRIPELQARMINLTDELTAIRLKIQPGEMEEDLKKAEDQLDVVEAVILELEQTKKQPPVKLLYNEDTMFPQLSSRLPFGLQGIVEIMSAFLRGDNVESAKLIVVKNVADSMIYTIEKGLSEDKDQIPAEVASEIESAVANVRTAVAGDDIGRIKETLDAAKKVMSNAGGIERKLQIVGKNFVYSIIYITEKCLSACKDKIPTEVASEIESAVANLRTALAGDDVGRIKEMLAVAEKAVSKVTN